MEELFLIVTQPTNRYGPICHIAKIKISIMALSPALNHLHITLYQRYRSHAKICIFPLQIMGDLLANLQLNQQQSVIQYFFISLKILFCVVEDIPMIYHTDKNFEECTKGYGNKTKN